MEIRYHCEDAILPDIIHLESSVFIFKYYTLFNPCLASLVFSEAFGVEKDTIIKTEYIRASSGNAHYGRLNFPSGAWEERARFGTTYLEISIGRRLSLFTAVATQGSGVKVEWVKTYKLSYNRWGEEWMVYNEDGKAKVRHTCQ